MNAGDLAGRLVFVAGMSRAGTTFLYHNLQKHPRIYVPARKEVCYFAQNFDEGPAWFAGFWEGMRPDQIGLDICGVYFVEPAALDRILAFDPNARVVLGIRDPVDWLISLYEQYQGNFDVPPFGRFLDGCTIRREGKTIELRFEEGMIRQTTEAYRERLGDRLLVYDFELLGRDPLRLLRAIESFAGLEGWFGPDNFTDERINARGRLRSERFDRLLQRPGIANAISRLVPRPVLLRVRSAVERVSARRARRPRPPREERYDPADLRRLERMFADDRAYIAALFSDSPLVGASV